MLVIGSKVRVRHGANVNKEGEVYQIRQHPFPVGVNKLQGRVDTHVAWFREDELEALG